MRVSIIQRLKLAWKAFNLKEFEVVIEPYHKVAALAYNDKGNAKFCLEDGSPAIEKCSSNGCTNSSRECLSRMMAVFRIVSEDHVHVCHYCSYEMTMGVVIE